VRFHLGGPPKNPNFQPDQSGWTAIREPGPILLNILAVPFILLALVLLSVAWGREPEFPIADDPSMSGPFAPLPGLLAVLLVGFPAVIAVHGGGDDVRHLVLRL
jgi:hypothetical protein